MGAVSVVGFGKVANRGFAVDGWCGELFEVEQGVYPVCFSFQAFWVEVGFSVLPGVSVVFRFGCGEAYG